MPARICRPPAICSSRPLRRPCARRTPRRCRWPRPLTSTAACSWRRRGRRAISSAAWSAAPRTLSVEIRGACGRLGDPVGRSDGRPGLRCTGCRAGDEVLRPRPPWRRDRDVASERVDPVVVEGLLGDRFDGLTDARYGPEDPGGVAGRGRLASPGTRRVQVSPAESSTSLGRRRRSGARREAQRSCWFYNLNRSPDRCLGAADRRGPWAPPAESQHQATAGGSRRPDGVARG